MPRTVTAGVAPPASAPVGRNGSPRARRCRRALPTTAARAVGAVAATGAALAAVLLGSAAVPAAVPARSVPAGSAPRADGVLARPRSAEAAGTLLVNHGPAARRITLVLIGDGYTRAELPAFRRQAARTWRAISSIEPFRTYQRFFDVRRIDLASPRSGVPGGGGGAGGAGGDTPLGLHFGCDGTRRLLCADDDAVRRLAGPAEGPRYVIALADSSEYGGAGGGDGVTTLSGGSPDADAIIQHEIGHTIGGLGDEYDAAPGRADDYPDLSAEDAAGMCRDRVKWWRWLGAADPSGGRVGAYRSGNGLFRPTRDSVMRTLGGRYNLPSLEALVEQLYRLVSPLDAALPAPAAGPMRVGTRLRAVPQRLVGGRQLTVSWLVGGRPAPARAVHGDTLDTARLGLPRGGRTTGGRTVTVTAVVRDDSPWVRDPAFRAERMTARAQWQVTS